VKAQTLYSRVHDCLWTRTVRMLDCETELGLSEPGRTDQVELLNLRHEIALLRRRVGRSA